MKRVVWGSVGILLGAVVLAAMPSDVSAGAAEHKEQMQQHSKERKVATFAGGCFWCMQPPFDSLPGVLSTRVGYAGGTVHNPTYEQVSSGRTGHAEAVEVTFDNSQISYSELVKIFWRNIDPTASNQQFADRGTQYRTAIFYHDDEQRQQAEASKAELERSGKYDRPIVTEILPAGVFYEAEEYHQEYYKKNVLHYQMYKVGSGRAGYLKRMWGEEASSAPAGAREGEPGTTEEPEDSM